MPELEHLNTLTNQKTISKGEIITLDDDIVLRFANIISGTVKLSKILSDGREQIVGLQFAPEFVGRPFQENANLTAEAASDVELCFLPRKEVEKLLDSSGPFKQRLLSQTLVQLDEARDWLVTLGRKTAAERIASILVFLDKHIGKDVANQPGAREIVLPLTRHEIADYLGLTIETVSRQITRFRKAGLIEVSHNNDVVVPSISELQSRCGD